MAPSPSTGWGPVVISQGISVIMPELMVQRAWACVARRTAGAWRLCAPAPRALTGMRQAWGSCELRSQKTRHHLQENSRPRAGLASWGRVHSCSDRQRFPPVLPADPRVRQPPTQPASRECRHHSSSLPPQKDVVNPPRSHLQLAPRAHLEVARH